MTIQSKFSMVAFAAVHTAALAFAPLTHAQQPQADWPAPMHDDHRFAKLLIDRLEYAAGDEEDTLNWEAQFWYGGDYQRLWIETEGEDVVSGGEGGHVEKFDVLYSRLIAPYWDVQTGVGYETTYGPGPDRDRASALIGLQGLAPYWFEVDANLRVSEDGDLSAEFEAEYDWLFTQRLVLQPRFATSYAFDEVAEFGVGKGLNSVRLGLRLRYEIKREFAPYIGVTWSEQFGDTADLAEAEGEETDSTALVAGVRMWF